MDAGKIRLIKASLAEEVTQPATRAAGLIIIISELSNIGQTQSCTPDHLDQTILETRDPSEFRRIKVFSVEERGYRREYMNTSTLLALVFVFWSLISLLLVNPTGDTIESQWGDHPTRISEVGLRSRMER